MDNQDKVSLQKSLVREIALNSNRTFPTFLDLLQHLIDSGQVSGKEDLLLRKPDLLGSILFKWYSLGQISCIFAQRLAKKPTDAKWQSIIVQGDISPELLSPILEQAAAQLEAIQLIFPGDGSATQAVTIINALTEHDSWSCWEIDFINSENGPSLQVGLRWRSPDVKYVSWVLGIAPFDSMPFTRRLVGAPFIALVLRPSPPTTFADVPQDESGLPASHLAHMDDLLNDDQGKRKASTIATKRAKMALLGSGLRSTARAKVTFSLPTWCREYLVKLHSLPENDTEQ